MSILDRERRTAKTTTAAALGVLLSRSGLPSKKNHGADVQAARRGCPLGRRANEHSPREKVTLRIPGSLIAEYRDRSWIARCSLSGLVERAMIDYQPAFRE